METVVFLISAVIVLTGAIGVVASRNPVHAALSMVMTLFGVAVLFINLEAHFLAAVQVIVYAGAIVVLFLFVLMLLGVDRAEDLAVEPIAGQRPIAVALGAITLGLAVAFMVAAGDAPTGASTAVGPLADGANDIHAIARVLFTDYVLAFEVTGLLLTIAVVGAVLLARFPKGPLQAVPSSSSAGNEGDS